MNPEEANADEASILTRLLACDEALAAGTPPQQAVGVETPAELQPRLEGDVACIQVLRKVLLRRTSGEAQEPATSELPMLASAASEMPVPLATDGNGASPVLDLPFRELGRFRLQRLLGQGAFGMVFLAADPKLGRSVALKVPRPEALLTGELRERFVREARAAAGLDHPNLVPVYESGAVGPLCYIASAYCPGITLAEWIKQRPELPPERLAAILAATLADAVHHAHARGVIHRDLKPSNVLLQVRRRDADDPNSTVPDPDGVRDFAAAEGSLIPRITDFGLAKLIADGPTPTAGAGGVETRTGAILGTPNYMAPEQASGKNKEVGPAADIYALGAILYELSTGRPPFRGESLLDTLQQVRSREPLPPGRLRPKMARDLETICLKCLQKEPHKRYDSASTLAADLRRYLAGEPIQARPVPAWERGLKWARRKPAQALLFAATLAIIAVVLGYTAALGHTNKRLKKTNADLEIALDAKDKALTEEDRQRRRADRFSYVSDMNLAQQDWASARLGRLRELLERQRPEIEARDLRGFEWYYWDRLANHSARQTLEGHTEVLCMACSPDGKILAAGGKDGTIRFWDAASGRQLKVLSKFREPVTAVAFAERGKALVAASNRTVCLFDVSGGKPPRTLPTRGVEIHAAAAAGDRLALGYRDGSVEIWDSEGKAPRYTQHELKGYVWSVAFSADGSRFTAGGNDDIAPVWDTATGERLALCKCQQPSVIHGIALSPDGKHLATACRDGTIRHWDLAAGNERLSMGHSGRALSVQFAPDGKTLASASADATVRLWDAGNGSPRFVLKGHTDAVQSAIFTPDGRTLVSAGTDRLLKLWDTQRNPDYSSWKGHTRPVMHLAFTKDGSALATGAADGSVKLWEPATGWRLRDLPSHPQPIQSLAFAPDGKHLAVATLDLFVYIYDRQTAKEIVRLPGHTLKVTAVAFSPDGKLLASGGLDCSVRIWDWQAQKTLAVLADHKLGIRGLAFSPDGKLLASSSLDHTIKIWEPGTGQLRNTLRDQEAAVWGLAFSPNGGILASGSEDKSVRLWNVATGESLRTLRGHAGVVRSLAFSPDGRTLATASGELKLWQTSTGRELAAFTEPSGVWSVAWAPLGRLLLGGSSNGSIVRWDAEAIAP